MKRSLALFLLYRHRLKLFLLLISHYSLNRVHVVRESCDGKKIPALASGNVMHAAIRARRIIQPDPARQMRHRLCARPVRIVLMPRDDSAVMRWLTEKLVVPEAHGAT